MRAACIDTMFIGCGCFQWTHEPGTFNRRCIGTERWLRKCLIMLVIKEDLAHRGGVLVQEWPKYRLEHLSLVPLSSQFSTKSTDMRDIALMDMHGRSKSFGSASDKPIGCPQSSFSQLGCWWQCMLFFVLWDHWYGNYSLSLKQWN